MADPSQRFGGEEWGPSKLQKQLFLYPTLSEIGAPQVSARGTSGSRMERTLTISGAGKMYETSVKQQEGKN